ncbi:MAG: hypothetical protein ACOC92_01030 [bacterium]
MSPKLPTRLLAALLAVGSTTPLYADVSLLYRLVPVTNASPATATLDPAQALPDGQVFLYREGAYLPELILQANEPGRVPPGTWVWTAEAEGYASVVAGTLKIPPDLEQADTKTIVWPVVPACLLVLDADAEWSGVHRLDAVSVTSDAVYPVDPDHRRELWVPAGRLLAYAVGARGLQGIEDLGQCAQHQVVDVAPPAPPGPSRQDLLVTAHLPDELSPESQDQLSVHLDGLAASRLHPAAEVSVDNRLSAFFLDAPATRDGDVVFHHPELRTRRVHLQSLGGSARELPEERLEPRLDLSLQVDYRPLREHERAEIRISHCGLTQTLDARSFGHCEPLAERPALREGLHTYTIESADDGLYLLEAWIDDFVVPGLGASIRPYINPDSQHPPDLARGLLRELEIHGTLLLDGDPVPGTVALLAPAETHRRLPDHRFPTQDDGSFRLSYFGRLPGPYGTPPGFDDSPNPEDRLGLYYGDYQLVACTTEGFCRPFSVHSVLQGEGRLDLELGDRLPVEVHVTDATTGEPVPHALVIVPGPEEALYFHHGDVDWFEPLGSEGASVRTGPGGTGRILAQERDGQVSVLVNHPDYERARRTAAVLPGQRIQLDIALEPTEDRVGSHRFVFPDDAPLNAGFALVIDPQTGLDARCSHTVSSRGYADLPDECLYGRTVVLVAPGARISTFGGTSLASFETVEVPRAPSRPLRIRVTDQDGRPVQGLPVRLRYPDVTLGPNHLLMAATAAGYHAFFLTNAEGQLTLRGVDPEAATPPELGVVVGEKTRWYSLTGYRAGETVSLTLDGS